MSASTPLDSAAFLRMKLHAMAKSNPRYSLRAFAKKLEFSPGALSSILSRKKQLSLARAHALADKLGLDPNEKEEFLLIVQLETAKSSSVKNEAYEKLKVRSNNERRFNLSIEQFQMVSQWYGLALLELVTHFGASWSPAQMAKYFGVHKIDIEVMLDRLVRLEFIERVEGGFRRLTDRVWMGSSVPNEAIRSYYRGVLEKVEESIDAQSPAEKVIGSEVFAFDPAQLEMVRKITDDYLNSLQTLSRKGKKRTEIYQAIVDVFSLKARDEMKGNEK